MKLSFIICIAFLSQNLFAKCSCKDLLKILTKKNFGYDHYSSDGTKKVTVIITPNIVERGVAYFDYMMPGDRQQDFMFYFNYHKRDGGEKKKCKLIDSSLENRVEVFASKCSVEKNTFTLQLQGPVNKVQFRYKKQKF